LSAAVRPDDYRLVEGDVGFLARLWHPVWAIQTK